LSQKNTNIFKDRKKIFPSGEGKNQRSLFFPFHLTGIRLYRYDVLKSQKAELLRYFLFQESEHVKVKKMSKSESLKTT